MWRRFGLIRAYKHTKKPGARGGQRGPTPFISRFSVHVPESVAGDESSVRNGRRDTAKAGLEFAYEDGRRPAELCLGYPVQSCRIAADTLAWLRGIGVRPSGGVASGWCVFFEAATERVSAMGHRGAHPSHIWFACASDVRRSTMATCTTQSRSVASCTIQLVFCGRLSRICSASRSRRRRSSASRS